MVENNEQNEKTPDEKAVDNAARIAELKQRIATARMSGDSGELERLRSEAAQLGLPPSAVGEIQSDINTAASESNAVDILEDSQIATARRAFNTSMFSRFSSSEQALFNSFNPNETYSFAARDANGNLTGGTTEVKGEQLQHDLAVVKYNTLSAGDKAQVDQEQSQMNPGGAKKTESQKLDELNTSVRELRDQTLDQITREGRAKGKKDQDITDEVNRTNQHFNRALGSIRQTQNAVAAAEADTKTPPEIKNVVVNDAKQTMAGTLQTEVIDQGLLKGQNDNSKSASTGWGVAADFPMKSDTQFKPTDVTLAAGGFGPGQSVNAR